MSAPVKLIRKLQREFSSLSEQEIHGAFDDELDENEKSILNLRNCLGTQRGTLAEVMAISGLPRKQILQVQKKAATKLKFWLNPLQKREEAMAGSHLYD